MSTFNVHAYEHLLDDIIDCCFYSDVRPRIKIAHYRQLAEVLIRKLLSIDIDEKVMLGRYIHDARMKSHFDYDPILFESLNLIHQYGNDCTHTQFVERVNAERSNELLKSIIYVYSYLFIDYFRVNKFNNNRLVVSFFSILPPAIRVNVLTAIHKNDPDNISALSKLTIAMLKESGLGVSMRWIFMNKVKINQLNSLFARLIVDKSQSYCIPFSNEFVVDDFKSKYFVDNLYDYLIFDLISIDATIKSEGVRYNSFESAKQLYLNKKEEFSFYGDLNGFITLMNFVYLGRRSFPNPNIYKPDSAYIISR